MSNLFTGVPAVPGATSNNPRYSSRSPFRFYLFVVFAGMLVFARPIPAFASGNVSVIYPPPAITTPLGWGNACFEMNGQGLCGVKTAGAACYYWNIQYGWSFNWTGQIIILSPTSWNCPMTRESKTYNFTLNLVTPAICPVPSSGPSYVWNPNDGLCTRSDCPDNATGEPQVNPSSCTCDDKYQPDSTGKSCESVAACPDHANGTPCACDAGYKFDTAGTSCVPIVPCPVSDLPPITDPEVQAFENNPDLSDTARLSDRMGMNTGGALLCLRTAISDAGGTSSVGSAYRPPAYNQHLIDVWNKWGELLDERRPECQARRTKIKAHYDRHELVHEPHPSSAHTRGEAFDLTSNLPYANLDALAEGCHVYRNIPVRDRVHFIHR